MYQLSRTATPIRNSNTRNHFRFPQSAGLLHTSRFCATYEAKYPSPIRCARPDRGLFGPGLGSEVPSPAKPSSASSGLRSRGLSEITACNSRMVVSMFACPDNPCTTRTFVPSSNKCVANECLNTWGVLQRPADNAAARIKSRNGTHVSVVPPFLFPSRLLRSATSAAPDRQFHRLVVLLHQPDPLPSRARRNFPLFLPQRRSLPRFTNTSLVSSVPPHPRHTLMQAGGLHHGGITAAEPPLAGSRPGRGA